MCTEIIIVQTCEGILILMFDPKYKHWKLIKPEML